MRMKDVTRVLLDPRHASSLDVPLTVKLVMEQNKEPVIESIYAMLMEHANLKLKH
jgi:hypothetical protein